jgi:hypothetical protein
MSSISGRERTPVIATGAAASLALARRRVARASPLHARDEREHADAPPARTDLTRHLGGAERSMNAWWCGIASTQRAMSLADAFG